jgi:hypothetical protein
MKKSLLLLVLFFVCCKSDDRCGEILDKIITPDQYIFVICFDGCNRITNSDFQGSMQSDVKVDELTFDMFKEGDNYCVE